jgi:lysophospholipase L1-like esterase
VAVALLALEGALRAFWPQDVPFAGLFAADPAVGVRNIPGTSTILPGEDHPVAVRINSRGFRGREHDWSAPHGFRILGIGDSFTFGYGVDEQDTYLSRLEALLQGRAEVINAGVAGTGPDEQARLLAADGPGLRPDLVVVGFVVGHDLADVVTGPDRLALVDGSPRLPDGFVERWYRPLRPGRILDSPMVESPSGLGLPIPFKAFLRRHSHAYRFLSRRVALLRQSRPGDTAGAPAAEFTLFAPEAFCLKSDPPEFEQAWSRAEQRLGEMKAWCDGHGARLAVVAIPTEAQVDPDAWDAARRRYGLREEDFDLEKPQRVLTAFAAERGIPLIDLLPALRAARGTGPRLYSRSDIHWTPRGHAVAAEEILRRLRSSSLLPRE